MDIDCASGIGVGENTDEDMTFGSNLAALS
jgi:hypothetical protein